MTRLTAAESMKERPIIFSGAMVRAILSGAKTQTRRIVKLPRWAVPGQDIEIGEHGWPEAEATVSGCHPDIPCPYGTVGDRLWVRETWRQAYPEMSFSKGVVYRADAAKSLGMDEYSDRHTWKPSIFMPRSLSRITLEITEVRVQRLQDISQSDVFAEGLRNRDMKPEHSAQQAYAELWDTINGKKYPWASNPWIWALTFKRIAS